MKLNSPLPPACVLALAAVLTGCGKPRESVKQSPPAVTVRHPAQQDVTDCLELTGTVTPSRSVDLVARVTGYLGDGHGGAVALRH
jgi:multidrug efflux pump subunit AcrA (membrane-fusion protein)